MMLGCGCVLFCGQLVRGCPRLRKCGYPPCRTATHSERCKAHTKPPLGPVAKWIAEEKAMKQEFVQVPVEVVRELKRTVGKWDDDLSANSKSLANHMAACIRGLPDPPKPDVVEECARIHLERDGMNDWDKCMVRSHLKADMLAALKKYRAMGCPELDE